MPRSTSVLITASMLVGATACGGGSQASVTTSSAPTSEAPAPTAEPEVTTPAPAVTTAAASQDKVISFTMPNLVGKDLQTAQNTVQTYGVFYSISHDLLGSRHQVVDSNWMVCSQTPRAGSTVRGTGSDLEGKIDFGVVKRGESCP